MFGLRLNPLSFLYMCTGGEW